MTQDYNKKLPSIHKDLIEELNRLFPEQSAKLTQSPNELYFQGGQRSVINYLKEQFNRQTETILKGE